MQDEIQSPEISQETEVQRIPEIRDRRSTPEGVVAKQAQGYIIAGLAILILLAVMFSNSRAKTTAKPSPSIPAAYSSDANQRSIEQLKRELTEEQQRGERQAQPQTNSAVDTPAPHETVLHDPGTLPASSPATVPPEPPRDPVADAERALSFKARFASNLVAPRAESAVPTPPDHQPMRQPGSDHSGAPEVSSKFSDRATPSGSAKRSPEVNVNSAHGQPYVIFEGTMIDTALVNRLDGEFPGPAKVMVTNPVYSQDRQHVLIPEGTIILGDVQKVSGLGQRRLALVFHRLIMPDGSFVKIDPRQNRIKPGNWQNEFERPIYFVELRNSYVCSWCELSGNQLILLPYPHSGVQLRQVRYPLDADVVGRVTAVTMCIADPIELP